MRGIEILRLALSDLRHRRGTILLNVLAVAITAIYILLLGAFAASVHRHQRDLLAGSAPTKIIAATADIADPRQRFNETKLAWIAQMPGVRLVYPHVEIGVRLFVLPEVGSDVPLEGLVADDAARAGRRTVWGGGLAPEERETILLSRATFERLGGHVGASPEPGTVTVEVRRTSGGHEQVKRIPLRIAGLLGPPADDRVYVAVGLAEELDHWCTGKQETVALRYDHACAYGPLEHAGRVQEEVEALGLVAATDGSLVYRESAGPVWVRLGPGKRAPTDWDAERFPVWRWRVGGRSVALLAKDDPRLGHLRSPAEGGPILQVPRGLPLDSDLAGECMAVMRHLREQRCRELLSGAGVVSHLALETAALLVLGGGPGGLAPVAAWLLQTSAMADPGRGQREEHMRFADPCVWTSGEEDARRRGLAPVVLTPLRTQRWNRYRITDGRSKDGSVDAAAVGALAMGRPAFVTARAHLHVTVRVRGVSLPLVGSDADDPARFLAGLLRGAWFSDARGLRQVVLPARLGIRVGEATVLRAERASGTVDVPVNVVGVVRGDQCYAPMGLVEGVTRWQSGSWVYQEERASFESPLDIAKRVGHVRCAIIAADVDHVDGIVSALQGAGYRTEDSSAQRRWLAHVERMLSVLVSVFVVGNLVNGVLAVWVTARLNVRTKLREIGILRVHGLRPREIATLFAWEGALIGAAAFVAALAVAFTSQRAVASTVGNLLRTGKEVGEQVSLLDPSLGWLIGVAAAVSILSSVAGVVGPALGASRLAPVEALYRRD